MRCARSPALQWGMLSNNRIKKACLVFLTSIVCIVASVAGVIESAKGRHPGECVVLLHGLGRSSLSMKPMEWYLRAQGYEVRNLSYPSRRLSIPELGNRWLPQRLQGFEGNSDVRVHFVTHSMGGIVVRQFLSGARNCNVGRVVMLAPPNHGSEVADHLQKLRWFKKLMGPAAMALGSGPDSAPNALGPIGVETAIIAANRSWNPWFSAWLKGRDDGRVSVASTSLEGMKARVVLRSTHSGVLCKPEAWKTTAKFLETGSIARF